MTTSPTGMLPSGTGTSCAARHGTGQEIQPWRRPGEPPHNPRRGAVADRQPARGELIGVVGSSSRGDLGSYPAAMTETGSGRTLGSLLASRRRGRFVGRASEIELFYERLNRFPDGLLVVGDAVCHTNPIHGQGMTMAALAALALRRRLQGGTVPSPRRWFRAPAGRRLPCSPARRRRPRRPAGQRPCPGRRPGRATPVTPTTRHRRPRAAGKPASSGGHPPGGRWGRRCQHAGRPAASAASPIPPATRAVLKDRCHRREGRIVLDG
jgi:hypothetical protein